ncbi:MAG: flagellar biosynthetic protein FliQ [Candidatus Auribacterota bacterium]|jgi:flagellar biosynthetic protein FliQ|nr:flagellar biosynthetic protein FliQ [Candidatus Auribacterota bacterium]
MTTEWVMGMGRQCLIVILSLAMPMLGVGMVVGVLMSIVQTVTAIKDQSLTTVIKIVSVIVAMLVSLPFIVNTLVAFTTNLFMALPMLVGK